MSDQEPLRFPKTPTETLPPEDIKTTEEAAQPSGQIPIPPAINFKNTATVEIFDQDGKVASSQVVPRGFASLLRYLGELVGKDRDKLSTQVRITITPEEGQARQPDGSEYLIETKGSIQEVSGTMMQKAINPQHLMDSFQQLAIRGFEFSSLKGVIVTAVFGDAQAGGFGGLSTVIKVEDVDIVTLIESAKNQIDLFRERIKTDHPDVTLPSESRIVLPNGKRA